jgi:hypothetical protein
MGSELSQITLMVIAVGNKWKLANGIAKARFGVFYFLKKFRYFI